MSKFRRGILARALHITPSEWVLEWTPSKGDLTENGFSVSGDNGYGGGYELTNEGQLFTVRNSQNVVVRKDTTATSSVILQAKINISALSDLGIEWYISNGTTVGKVVIRYYNNEYQLRVQTAQYQYVTLNGIDSFLDNTDCVIRIEYEQDQNIKVYLNNTLYYDGASYDTGTGDTIIEVRYISTMLLKELNLKY